MNRAVKLVPIEDDAVVDHKDEHEKREDDGQDDHDDDDIDHDDEPEKMDDLTLACLGKLSCKGNRAASFQPALACCCLAAEEKKSLIVFKIRPPGQK